MTLVEEVEIEQAKEVVANARAWLASQRGKNPPKPVGALTGFLFPTSLIPPPPLNIYRLVMAVDLLKRNGIEA
jgi:hypothetical protein